MLRNFFKTAGRNILKYKAYSIINFIGLTSGLALSLLIMSYVRSELSYDKFHEKVERVYRLNYTVPNGLKLATTPPPIAPLMKDFFPEVEEAARMYSRNVTISHPEEQGGASFEESGIYFADSSIFKIFTFQFVKGNPKNPLRDPFTLLITEEMATKYFGDKNPIGEALVFGGNHSFKITGVIKEFPENSHIRFHMLAPYHNMFDLESDETAVRMKANLAMNYVISHGLTYVLLKPGASSSGVDQNMKAFLDKHASPQVNVGQVFYLMPVADIHLKSDMLDEPTSTNTMSNLYIFIAIGILTLLIACINYINLSTAQSFTRIKEIGIRKILGSAKGQLIGQFISESFLFCLIALILSFGVFYLALPLLNQFTNKELEFFNVFDVQLVLISIGILLLITLLAGGYPAYFVAQFNSVSSLKGSGGGQLEGGQLFRKTLVVFQLAVACMLLSGSLMLVKQMNFLTEQPLGFQRENLVTISLRSQNLNGIFSRPDSTFRSRLRTFRDRIEQQAGIQSTAGSFGTPGVGAIYRGTIPEGFTKEDNMFIANFSVDYDFISAYGMDMVAGRTFSESFGTDDKEAFIVNETAVNEFHWGTPDQAIGKTINREGKLGKVIGVIKDFNITSLTTAISPVILEITPNAWNTLNVKFTSSNVPGTIDIIRNEWNKLFPEKAFEFSFLDEQLNQQYTNYRNFGSVIKSFTFIAILISCLGVYGLVLFTVQRKVKEIGVRKVLGASIPNILKLIYSDFLLLLAIAFVVALPVSWYFINKWLENFIFHTSVDPITYTISFLVVLMVMSLTISYHAVKASLANPVHSLRSE
jgi:putative ABC transport system permease protein